MLRSIASIYAAEEKDPTDIREEPIAESPTTGEVFVPTEVEKAVETLQELGKTDDEIVEMVVDIYEEPKAEEVVEEKLEE